MRTRLFISSMRPLSFRTRATVAGSRLVAALEVWWEAFLSRD